jgi:hypothetical protein
MFVELGNVKTSGADLSPLFYLSKWKSMNGYPHIRQNRHCSQKNSGVKLQKHLNHIAGRAEGGLCFLRKAIRVEGKIIIKIKKQLKIKDL